MTESEVIRELEWAKSRLMRCSHINTNRMHAFFMAIKALEEVQQYRKHGLTVENALDNMCDLAAAENLIEEYRAIGTPEECRAAVEKQKEMITYCDENDCSDCPFHNTSKKYNKCMNDFIAEEIVKGGGV